MGKPRIYLWTGVDKHRSDAELAARATSWKERGLSGVFLGAPLGDRHFPILKTAGLEAHAWMWTTNRGDEWIRANHPEWYMVSRTGKSCFDQPPYVPYYRWVTPANPDVVRYICDRAAELAESQDIDGVHLDYVRFPDVILPRDLWDTYGLDQTEELPEYDFDYGPAIVAAFQEAAGRDPREIADPAHDQEWLHFRYDLVTNLVHRISGVVRARQKALTAAVFPTPRLARRICRQDWDKWPLDAVCPMIYHSFYREGVEWIGDCVLEDVQAVSFPVIAGLYLPAFQTQSEFAEGLRLVQKRGGGGISLFGEVTDEHWATVEAFLAD